MRAERILVADDNADMRQLIRRILEPHWAVEVVEDGTKALHSARAESPCLIVAEAMMPGLDGLELLRQLRGDARTATIPVILLSARASEEAKLEGLKRGADDYIAKPFGASELLARIGARVEMGRVRREAETRITSILECVTSGFQVCDASWRVTYMNPPARQLLAAHDIDPEAIIGKHLWDDVFPQLRDSEGGKAMHRAMAERVPVYFENYYEPWRRWFDNYICPLPDGGLAVEFRDVTPRKLAETERSELEARFRAMADSAPIVIWVADRTGRSQFVNQACLDFVGITREETETFDLSQVVHPDDRAVHMVAFHHALRERQPFHSRVRGRRHDGAWRWFETRGNPLLDDTGQLTAFIGCSADITDIVESKKALEEADRRKDEFLAVLAHELRNPLASIMTGARLLHRLGPSARESEVTRDMIEREARQLSRLVDDLLDVSRITAGRIVLRKDTVDLREIVNRAIETTRSSFEARKHRLELALPGGPLPVEGDGLRLGQVLSNLMNNAAKYTNPGGLIRLTAGATGGQAEVRVSDNGIGIAAADLPRIFELFSRIPRSQAQAAGGLGIGLTLSRRLVELHGGSLDAFSEGPGRGSEFVVRLPLAASPSKEDLPPTVKASTPGSASRRRILLIDDNESFAFALSTLLEVMGHDVRAIRDGWTAIATGRTFRPHIVLLDIGLPDIDGYEVAREMRKTPELATAMIIAVTGYGQEPDKQRSKAAGIDYHLTKPIDEKVLETLIETAAD